LPKETIADLQAAACSVLQPRRWRHELDIPHLLDVQMALGEATVGRLVYGVVGVHPLFVALLDDRVGEKTSGGDRRR